MVTILAILSLIALVIMSLVTAGAEGNDKKPWMHLITLGLGGLSIIFLVCDFIGRFR